MTVSKFLDVCGDLGYRVMKKSLLNLVKVGGPKVPPSSRWQRILESNRYALRREFGLQDLTLELAKQIAGSAGLKLQGRHPGCIAAASLYLASPTITQRELADFFGITEVSVRNAVKAIIPEPRVVKLLIQKRLGPSGLRVEAVQPKPPNGWDGFCAPEWLTCALCNRTIQGEGFLTAVVAVKGTGCTDRRVLGICWRCVLGIQGPAPSAASGSSGL